MVSSRPPTTEFIFEIRYHLQLANGTLAIGVAFSNLPMSNRYRQRKPESIASSPSKRNSSQREELD
ncbi:hypothetical protein DAPPUDRAFT_233194 [Daphnia pulex]|uniref:Uncharacterized protein n=1 Tax=Daphnia pulex TaxID=6669 RepID=E9FTH1_DAPPU|nr:hypothetical protein DAPPUDRAFT_233194 [Daphnia pulex]|eukprot:EFX89635.1 hypothetical protein DAPPUDRAFT_233194 [Daphnia pulex]